MLNTKQIAIRAEANPIIGGGHIYRMLTLAAKLRERGAHIIFWVNSEAPDMIPALRDWPYRIVPGDQLGTAFVSKLQANIDLLIVDHYGWQAEHSDRLRKYAMPLMIMDDLADRFFDCDLLLNQNYAAPEDVYRSLGFDRDQLLLGTDYALLRPEFHENRMPTQSNRQAKHGQLDHLLINLGAGFHPTILEPLVARVRDLGLSNMSVTVITGRKGQAGLYKKHYEGRARDWQFLDHCQDMAALYCQADLAIGAAGSSVWERCCLGLPALHVILADNQVPIAQICEKLGAGFSFDTRVKGYETDLISKLVGLKSNPEQLADMQKRAFTLCDGLGAGRVVDSLEAHIFT